jgi:hypothetical protein
VVLAPGALIYGPAADVLYFHWYVKLLGTADHRPLLADRVLAVVGDPMTPGGTTELINAAAMTGVGSAKVSFVVANPVLFAVTMSLSMRPMSATTGV